MASSHGIKAALSYIVYGCPRPCKEEIMGSKAVFMSHKSSDMLIEHHHELLPSIRPYVITTSIE